jgi:hypothetical protein
MNIHLVIRDYPKTYEMMQLGMIKNRIIKFYFCLFL